MRLFYIALGAAALLAVKYFMVGLHTWNAALHPGRLEPPALKMFSDPFLGLFTKGTCGSGPCT